jgi:hypothetical protein
MDPAYWRAWRARHPGYRERQRRLRRERRARQGREDRRAEYARQRERRAELRAVQNGDNGSLLPDDPLLIQARAIAVRHRKPDRRTMLHRPVHEDVVGAVALALVAGEDPEEAARSVIREDTAWLMHTVPDLEW